MTQELKNGIKHSLQELQEKFTTLTTNEIANALETLYEKALLADFVATMEKRKSALLARVAQATEVHTTAPAEQPHTQTVQKEERTPAPPPAETQQTAETAFTMNPEIKVLPHPEGPPVMRHHEEEAPVAPAPPSKAPVHHAPVEAVKTPPATKPASIAERAQQNSKSTSLNDRLAAKKLAFGLNDRIAYVKHLFDGQGEDFTRVVNQINTYEAWEEAEVFINDMVKPDYNWEGKEEYEERFLTQIRARFEA